MRNHFPGALVTSDMSYCPCVFGYRYLANTQRGSEGVKAGEVKLITADRK